MSRGGRRPPSQPRPGSGCLLQARTWRPGWRARLKGGLRCGRGPLGLILGLGASARVSYWRLHAAEEQRGHRMPRPPVRRLLGVSGGGRPGERKEAGETLTATGLLRRSPPFAPWAAAHCPAGRSRGRADWTSPPPTPAPARLQTAKPSHPRASGVEWCTRRREGPGSGSKRGPGARILGGPGFRVRSEQEPVGGSRGGTEVAPRVPLQRGPRWARPSAARSGQAWRGAAGGGERWRPRVWAPRSCSWAPRPAPCARVSACRGGWGGAARDRVGAPLVSSRARARGRRGEGALRKTQSCARVPGPRKGSRCGLPRPGGGRSGAPSLCPGTR